MKTMVMGLLLAIFGADALAAERLVYGARTTTKLESGLVIVPFAIPVAVPVATVRQPSVLYSYRGAAASYQSPQIRSFTAPAHETSADAQAVFARHCGSCHRGSAAEGRMQLFDETGTLLGKLPRRRVLAAIEAGRMPLPAAEPRLSAAEIEVIRRWAEPPADLSY